MTGRERLDRHGPGRFAVVEVVDSGADVEPSDLGGEPEALGGPGSFSDGTPALRA